LRGIFLVLTLVKKKATPHPHAEGTEIGLGVLLLYQH
jgi:hypothetical protein